MSDDVVNEPLPSNFNRWTWVGPISTDINISTQVLFSLGFIHKRPFTEVFTLPHLIRMDFVSTPCSPWTVHGLCSDCTRTKFWWMSCLTSHPRPSFFFFFESTFYYTTVSNTCTAYSRRSQQVIREEGEEWYKRQSTVTLRDRGCGTQPQRTGTKGAGYGRPVRAKLRQGVGPQLRWLRRRRRSRVAPNQSGNPT
jgi:hypothetical protein